MLKELLIITLCTTLTLQATPGVTGEPIDTTSLYDVAYEYDKLNRVTKATYASGESISYKYDAGGNLLGVVFDDPNGVKDSDGDGVIDSKDAFPHDPKEWLDTDGDGIGNNADLDDDGDGHNDNVDAFPLNAKEWLDTDGDGTGNNADIDDDGDGHNDNTDAFPLNPKEWVDTDGDGIGNNADLDDDGDGMSDIDEYNWGFDSLNKNDADMDSDGDGISNVDEIKAGTNPWNVPFLQINRPIKRTIEGYGFTNYYVMSREYKKIYIKLSHFRGNISLFATTYANYCRAKSKKSTVECMIPSYRNEIIDIQITSESYEDTTFVIEAYTEDAKHKWTPIIIGDIMTFVPVNSSEK